MFFSRIIKLFWLNSLLVWIPVLLWAQSTTLDEANQLMQSGEYLEAEERYRELLESNPPESSKALLLFQMAELLKQTGRSTEALELLAPMVQSTSLSSLSISPSEATTSSNVSDSSAFPPTSTWAPVLSQYAQLLDFRGRRAEAVPLWEALVEAYYEGIITETSEMAMAAQASWALGNFHEANQIFRDAILDDPDAVDVKVQWGYLFLEKYNEADASGLFQEVLTKNEDHVPGLIGLAKTLANERARILLNQVLEINPNTVPAFEALAESYIQEDEFKTAKDYLNRALKVNPEALESRTLLAAIAVLEEQPAEQERQQNAVKQVHPTYAKFYSRVAEVLGRKYLFEEANQFAKQAVEVDPKYWKGYTTLGMNLLRLGDEAQGRDYLETSFENDPFNVWTLNTLRVLDVLDTYEVHHTENFTVKLSQADSVTLWPYLEPLLEEAWTKLTKKYQFTPKSPVLIELFEKHEDFAVRTLGLPNIGPLVGVCFGQVITMDSPRALMAANPANWQEILWHEFVHVITLQMTRNRMPRWLSEGISVYEEHEGRPEWGRKESLELTKAFHEGKILGMRELNDGFTKASSTADLSFAYYQSYLVVEYIVEHYGFDDLLVLIRQYSGSRDMETIFLNTFKQSLDEFEIGFFDWIEQRVKALDLFVLQTDPHHAGDGHGHGVRRNMMDTEYQAWNREFLLKRMRFRVQQQPRDFLAVFQLGLLLYREQEYDEAITYLKIAQDLVPDYNAYPNPHQVLAEIYETQGKSKQRLEQLQKLVRFQQHDFELPYELAQIEYKQGNHAQAIYYLERVLAVNPYHQETHRLLAKMASESSDYATAIREYKILLHQDTTDPVDAHTNLAEMLLKAGNKPEAKQHAISALEIAPTYERAQDILLSVIDGG